MLITKCENTQCITKQNRLIHKTMFKNIVTNVRDDNCPIVYITNNPDQLLN